MHVSLSHTERMYLREFWHFYQARLPDIFRQVRAEAGARLDQLPISHLESATNPEETVAEVIELIERAILRDEWGTLHARLQSIGTSYSHAGITLGTWYHLGRALRRLAILALENDALGDRRQHARIVEGLTLCEGIAMQSIADAYLRAQE